MYSSNGFSQIASLSRRSAFMGTSFASAAHGPSQGLAGPALGQTATEWYQRALAAVAEYERLKAIVPRIADLRTRADILDWLGNGFEQGTPEYRYLRVKGGATAGVAREGIGYYNDETRQERVIELEGYVDDLRERVGAAGMILDAPAPAPAPAPTPTPEPGTIIVKEGADLGTPIAIGAGAIALAILVSALT